MNDAWKRSTEFRDLKAYELRRARELRTAAKVRNEKVKTVQTWKRKKYKLDKIRKSDGGGIDAWRYVKHVARPLLWPACKARLAENPNFLLMEDNAPAHKCWYNNSEREKEGIPKVEWPANSPDFNPIERIWYLMKSRIQTRRGRERVTTVSRMKEVLQEEWDRITIEEINREIARLPKVMERCIAVNGGNNFHG
jgi:transposase